MWEQLRCRLRLHHWGPMHKYRDGGGWYKQCKNCRKQRDVPAALGGHAVG